MKILNLFKKKTEPEPAVKVSKNPRFKEEISLVIAYTESGKKLMYYKTYQTIATDDLQAYREKRNEIFKGYQQTIDKIHTDIRDNPSDPMLAVEDKSLLIKKSDFINAKILVTVEKGIHDS